MVEIVTEEIPSGIRRAESGERNTFLFAIGIHLTAHKSILLSRLRP
jgi:hypothetical protein